MSPYWLHGVFSGIGKTAFLEGRLKHIHDNNVATSNFSVIAFIRYQL
jgi:hypothetical protein